jgi:nucleoside-diphosphate-sugar epimerase
MKVMVTGGTGFVGAHLVRRLLSRGHQVTSLDKNRGLFDDELRSGGATLLSGSVTAASDVSRAMTGCELVYHLASPFGDIMQPDAVYWDIEVNGTRNVLEAASQLGVRRVVHCSTQGVHGIIEDPPGDEDSPMAPRDYYCYSKVEGEKVVQEYLQRGMDIVTVRPTSVYGPGDIRGWLKLYQMVAKGWFLMIGSGKTLNHPVYVENLVDLFELVADSAAARGRVYLAGDEEPVTLNQLVRSVAQVVRRDGDRGGLQGSRHPASGLSPPALLVQNQSCVPNRSGQKGARLSAENRTIRGACSYGLLVSSVWLPDPGQRRDSTTRLKRRLRLRRPAAGLSAPGWLPQAGHPGGREIAGTTSLPIGSTRSDRPAPGNTVSQHRVFSAPRCTQGRRAPVRQRRRRATGCRPSRPAPRSSAGHV